MNNKRCVRNLRPGDEITYEVGAKYIFADHKGLMGSVRVLVNGKPVETSSYAKISKIKKAIK